MTKIKGGNMLTKNYRVIKDDRYYIVVDNAGNVHHAGVFSNRAKAATALKKICWGEAVCGDVDLSA